jgi:hypothetical protein
MVVIHPYDYKRGFLGPRSAVGPVQYFRGNQGLIVDKAKPGYRLSFALGESGTCASFDIKLRRLLRHGDQKRIIALD